jgi:hypothetical protein
MVADLVAAAESSLLVALVTLVERIPVPPPTARRGRPVVYPDRLFLKALGIMVVRRLPRVGTLLAVLDEPTPEMRRLWALLSEGGRFPVRRTWERRLRAVPDALPAQIGCLGRHLVAALDPWAAAGRAAALDSTPLRARGGGWHRKHRLAGVVPHSSIDTEAGWTRSGWHGWVYGWKLHLVVTAAAVWIPLAAELTPANTADNVLAPALLPELPPDLRFLLADVAYDDPALRAAGAQAGLTPKLSPAQRHRVPGLLARGAEAFGFAGQVRTTKRIAPVLAVAFGVRYHPAHVSRLVRAWGWSVHLPARVRTYAPRGRTPVLRVPLTRDHLSVISAITPAGKLYLHVRERSLRGPDVVRFLRHLLDWLPGKLLVIWDGSPIHRARVVKAFLAAGAAARLQPEQLPAYAPDTSPDEGVWNHLKHVELANRCCRDLRHLRSVPRRAVLRLRQKPHLVRACIRQAGYEL